MTKIFTFVVTLILILALLCFFTGASFNLRAYMDNLNKLPEKPEIPNWQYVSDAWEGEITIRNIWDKLGAFFEFLGNCIAYPFEYLVYLGKTVYYLTDGMLEKDSANKIIRSNL